MKAISLFSGAGGLDLGLDAAGIQTVAACEIDPHARAVYARRWPDVPIHDDVTTFDGRAWRGRVDLVAGGSPCQDLSVAGRRQGLDGERSGLFWHQCRVAAECAAGWVLWENVAGALSSNDGEDFAAVLWGLTGLRPAVPEDGWRTVGVCVGPDRTAVWRLLDARWFGVAQRRRRVFVVAGPRGDCRPEVLLEPESCGGDSGTRPQAGQDVAGTLGGGAGSRGWAPDTDRMTFVPTSFRLIGFSESGHSAYYTAGIGSLRASDHKRPEAHLVTSFHLTQDPIHGDDGHTPALSAGNRNGCATVGVAFVSENQRGEVLETPYARQITTGGGKQGQGYPAIRQDTAVRRLTPRECERLMGWPDDFTRWSADGTELADSHRYRLCGNGVVAPVAEWIGRRLLAHVEAAA